MAEWQAALKRGIEASEARADGRGTASLSIIVILAAASGMAEIGA